MEYVKYQGILKEKKTRVESERRKSNMQYILKISCGLEEDLKTFEFYFLLYYKSQMTLDMGGFGKTLYRMLNNQMPKDLDDICL